MGVEDWRASDGDGWFLVTREVSNWRPVETSTTVNVDGVDHLIHRTGSLSGVGSFELPCWCK